MHYTMTDLMSKANGLEARRAFENTRLRRIKRRFNPTALSHENWVALVYPEAKLFLEGLTVERFKEMLNEHRELWHKRQEKNAYLKREIPEMFKLVETQRLYPLEEKRYKKCREKLEKRMKINSAVLFFEQERYRVMALNKAQELIEERKKIEKEKQSNSFSATNP